MAAPPSSAPSALRFTLVPVTVFAEAVKGARVVGLRIAAGRLHPLAQAILLVDSEVEIDDVEVRGAGIGIEMRGAASPVLVGNTVADCAAEGILISGPSAPWLSHNSLLRNGRAGIAAHDGANPVLLDNVFQNNGLELSESAKMNAAREKNFFLEIKPQRGGRKQ